MSDTVYIHNIELREPAQADIVHYQSAADEQTRGGAIAEQQRVIERATAIHQALTRSAQVAVTLQDIAATWGRLITRPLAFADPDGNVLGAWHPDDDMNPVRRATIERGRAPEVMAELSRLGHLRAIRESAGPVRVPPLPELGLPSRIACPVRLKESW